MGIFGAGKAGDAAAKPAGGMFASRGLHIGPRARRSGNIEDRRGAPFGPLDLAGFANAEEDELDPRVMDLIVRNPKLRGAAPEWWDAPSPKSKR